jgi:hypothetical protein
MRPQGSYTESDNKHVIVVWLDVGSLCTCRRLSVSVLRCRRASEPALINADAKLGAYGPQLGYPHTSAVRGAERLREPRPRAGRSAWRALYRQVGEMFVVAAFGPQARADLRRFDRTVRRALERLAKVEEG